MQKDANPNYRSRRTRGIWRDGKKNAWNIADYFRHEQMWNPNPNREIQDQIQTQLFQTKSKRVQSKIQTKTNPARSRYDERTVRKCQYCRSQLRIANHDNYRRYSRCETQQIQIAKSNADRRKIQIADDSADRVTGRGSWNFLQHTDTNVEVGERLKQKIQEWKERKSTKLNHNQLIPY